MEEPRIFAVKENSQIDITEYFDMVNELQKAYKQLTEHFGTKILSEINEERKRQIDKFGIQDWPCLDQDLLNRTGGCNPQRMCIEYEIPGQMRAKWAVEHKVKSGTLTYADIALEEFSEAISEFNIDKRRVELVQLATVVLAWIEKIDREKNVKSFAGK